MNTAEFRKELVKIMPGYKWTVHRYSCSTCLDATGTKSSGFNRLSTLSVTRCDKDGVVKYYVKSAGFGKRAPWLYETTDGTLARALRALQNHYEHMASIYGGHAFELRDARKK